MRNATPGVATAILRPLASRYSRCQASDVAGGAEDMDRIEVDGLRIAYQEAGSGPPVLLLHGALVDGRSWTRLVDRLSDEFRVVAWDAPGCGASSDPPRDFDLDGYVRVAAGLIEALDLGPCHVGGLSFGSMLALALYGSRPDLIASLLLVSAYAGWGGSLPPHEVTERRARAERNAHRPPGEWVDDFLVTLFDDSTPDDVVADTRSLILDVRPEGMLPMLNVAEADLRGVLPGIDVPTLLVYGEADRRSPPQVAEELASAIGGSRIVFVPGVGHEVAAEAPDALEREARAFLRQAS